MFANVCAFLTLFLPQSVSGARDGGDGLEQKEDHLHLPQAAGEYARPPCGMPARLYFAAERALGQSQLSRSPFCQ